MGTDYYGRDEDIQKIFSEGEVLESPEITIAYNSTRKNDESSLTITLRILGQKTEDYVTTANMTSIQSLVYIWLNERGLIWPSISGKQLMLKKIKTTPIPGTDIWEAECEYGKRDSEGQPAFVKPNFTFTTTAKTTKRVRSIQTVAATSLFGPNAAWDFGGQIGWNGEGWEGCDVFTPTLSFSRDIWLLEGSLTWDLMRELSDITGYVNADMFCGFYPGEVLFKGVTNTQRSSLASSSGDNSITLNYWGLTLSFECTPNVWVNFNGYEEYKRGWDYIWYLYLKDTVSISDSGTGYNDKFVCKYPAQMNIEQVYPETEFCPYFDFGYENGYITDDLDRLYP